MLCIYEDEHVPFLSPLTHTRPVYGLRLAGRTLFERIRDGFDDPVVILHTRQELAAVVRERFSLPVNRLPDDADVVFVNGRLVIDSAELVAKLLELVSARRAGIVIKSGNSVVAARVPGRAARPDLGNLIGDNAFDGLEEHTLDEARFVSRSWDLLDQLHAGIRLDYDHLVGVYRIFERPNVDLAPSAVLVNGEEVFIGEGSSIRDGAIIDASAGPVYIGRNVTVMENAVLTGPAFIGHGGTIKRHADIAAVATGPSCKIGGEMHDVIMQGFANKSHHGFLGHAVTGEWCNFGAGSSNSNLRNDYGSIKLYSEHLGRTEQTGRQFLGLVMGDHTKCSINTSFNTGSVIGVACNLFGSALHDRRISSFSWGNADDGYREYSVDKAIDVAERVMRRRKKELTTAERELLMSVHAATWRTTQ